MNPAEWNQARILGDPLDNRPETVNNEVTITRNEVKEKTGRKWQQEETGGKVEKGHAMYQRTNGSRKLVEPPNVVRSLFA